MKTNNKHTENEFPTLDLLKGQNGFTTPECYFEKLEQQILEKVTKEEKTRISWNYKWIGYAASAIVLLGISSVFLLNSTEENMEDLFGELTVSEYMEDFQETDLELDEALLLDEVALN